MDHLKNALGRREIAEPHAAEIAQAHVRRQPVHDQIGDGLRGKDLSAVRSRHDARGAVDGIAEEVAATALDDSGMQPAADEQLKPAIRHRRFDALLEFHAGQDRVARIVEDRMHAVAGHLHDLAVIRLDAGSGERVVPRETGTHPLRMLLPQPRALLDVGEQEGGDSRR